MTEIARKRVLLVIAGLPAGGAERQMALLARNLDRDAFEVGLLIFNAADKVHYRDVLDGSVWFRALGLSRADGVRLYPRLLGGIRRAVADFAPDIVHASLNVANHAVRVAALLGGWRFPVVTSVRVDFRAGYRRHEKLMERLLWRRSAHVICNAARTRDQLIADLGMPPDRVSAIANGLDETFFAEPSAPRPGWWPQGHVALTVGRFVPQKNHLGLVAAIAALAARDALGDWRFVFLGEGPLRAEIESAIAAAKLTDRILIAPPVAEIVPAYRAADLFILPSLFEGMPNALLEAAAAGCALAVAPGANEIGIVGEGRGWVLDEPVAVGLEAALGAPPAVRAAAGQAAREHVRRRFSARRAADETAAVYGGLR
jgi:glycosyltransferase involved in cell wall biosynthesis